LHVKVADPADAGRIAAAVRARLHERFRIEHATVEIER
jgi:Co/Zn/Cd efflux system component